MGKKPTIDFITREELDGTEELYTQNENYEPKEQKFTLRSVMNYVLDFFQQNLPQAINGLTLNTEKNYELGGTLIKDTQIDADTFELDLKKENVHLKISRTNPYWLQGKQTALLTTESPEKDTESHIGVTDHAIGSFAQVWSKKPIDGSQSYLHQNWANTVISSTEAGTKTSSKAQITATGVFLQCFDQGSTQKAGAITTGIAVNEFKRVKNDRQINLRIQEGSNSNELEILLIGLPSYENQQEAVSDNHPLNGLYKTSSGELRIVL
jgi:hypothetical protein